MWATLPSFEILGEQGKMLRQELTASIWIPSQVAADDLEQIWMILMSPPLNAVIIDVNHHAQLRHIYIYLWAQPITVEPSPQPRLFLFKGEIS